MAQKDPLIEALAEFATTPVARSTITEMLHRLSAHAFAPLGLRSASVHMRAEGRARLVATLDDGRDDGPAELDRLQEREQSGPSVEALTTGEPVLVTDVRNALRRWPCYSGQALELGVFATAGIPLRVNGETFGVLGLHRQCAREWSGADLASAEVMAGIATHCIMGAAALELRSHAIELQAMFDAWVAVERAKGVVAEQRNISIDDASSVLRRHTHDHNLEVPTVAEAVVNLVLRP